MEQTPVSIDDRNPTEEYSQCTVEEPPRVCYKGPSGTSLTLSGVEDYHVPGKRHSSRDFSLELP